MMSCLPAVSFPRPANRLKTLQLQLNPANFGCKGDCGNGTAKSGGHSRLRSIHRRLAPRGMATRRVFSGSPVRTLGGISLCDVT